MGLCLYKLPHECGSSKGLQVYEGEDGKITGYCWACNTYVPDPKGSGANIPARPPAKTREEILEEMAFISTLPSINLESRQLGTGALSHYDIRVGLSEFDGKTPAFAYFPYTEEGKIVRYKVKPLYESKCKSWSVGISNNVDLFGWEQAKQSGAKKLIIVEGEFDAPALMKIFKMHTKAEFVDHIPAICSIPNGAGSAARDIARLLPEIRRHFKDVSLCFDQDEAGIKAVEEVCKIAPDFKSITLPLKDANDCLLAGATKAAFKAAQFNSEKTKNSKIVWGREIHEAAKKQAEWGYSWPWKHVNKATKGIRLGETIYIGAGPKMGKSEIVNQLGAHFIKEHGWKILAAKPEEANNKTYKMLAGKLAATKFHDPEVPFDEKAYEEAGLLLKDNLAMLNLYQHVSYETLKQDVQYAANEGIKAAFIDPITNFTNGMDAATQNSKLQEIAQDLAATALDLGIVIFIFCHLRNPDTGPEHNRGGKVLTSQFAGSRAMSRSCNLMFGLEGNKDPDLSIEERNMRTLVLLEDREFGNVGRFDLYWDQNTTMFNEA